jgi:hypothetical protein
VSHLPLMVSTAMFNLVRSSPSWDDMSVMASTGFRDVTRLASGDPLMSHDIWVTNRDAVIHWLDRMAGELQRFRTMLEDAKDEDLLEAFAGAQVDRDAFLAAPPRRVPRETGDMKPDDTRRVLMDMVVGGMMGERMRKLRDITTNPPPMPEAAEGEDPEEAAKKKPMTVADRIAEGIRRDLEKMERERAEKEAKRKRSEES